MLGQRFGLTCTSTEYMKLFGVQCTKIQTVGFRSTLDYIQGLVITTIWATVLATGCPLRGQATREELGRQRHHKNLCRLS